MSLPFKNPMTTVGLTSQPGALKTFYEKFGSNTMLESNKLAYYINTPAYFQTCIENIRPEIMMSGTSIAAQHEEANSWSLEKTPIVGEVWGKVKSIAKDIGSTLGIGDETDTLTGLKQLYSIFKSRRASSIYPPSILFGLQDFIGVNLTDDFQYFVQDINLPDLRLNTETFDTFNSHYQVPTDTNIALSPTSNTLTMSLLDTLVPLNEYLFYPWMREVNNPVWSYESMPYSLADIKISFIHPEYAGDAAADTSPTGKAAQTATNIIGKGLNALASSIPVVGEGLGKGLENALNDPTKEPIFIYTFTDCYPIEVELLKPTQQQRSNFTRRVTFAFSQVFIKVSYITSTPITNKLVNRAVGAVNKKVSNLVGGLTSKIPALPLK